VRTQTAVFTKKDDILAGIFAVSTCVMTTLLSYFLAVSKLPAHRGVVRLQSCSAISAVVCVS
jgi:hypothetical protein